MRWSKFVLVLPLAGAALLALNSRADAQELVRALIFGTSADAICETPNDAGTLYEVVEHVAGDPLGLAYPDENIQLAVGQVYPDPDREWGFEILYRDPSLVYVDDPNLIDSPFGDRAGFGIFGPFDDSPNDRNIYPDACPEEIYDSFIGAKNFTMNCDETTVGNRVDPCATVMDPEGIIFRIDVPNGFYRFVGAVGSADNPHAHRILVENGGFGPPFDITEEHVVLVHNFDQSQYTIGEVAAGDRPGEGVFARVGFDDFVPPVGDAVFPDPQFVNMDESGFATTCSANSPVLEVTEGYIRVHCLQANSNTGPGANGGQDRNGGDMVLLELWRFDTEPTVPLTPRITRTFDPSTYGPGDSVTVTLSIAGIGGRSSSLDETVPAGWTITDNGGGTVSGSTISFDFSTDTEIVYTLQAPGCGENTFTGVLDVDGVDCSAPLVSAPFCDPGPCGIQSTGGVNDFLIIGPIALASDNNGGNCDDYGNFATSDYLTDGSTTEANILVEEGDTIEPDFGGASAGLGIGGYDETLLDVIPAPNVAINPDQAFGALTVWRAAANAEGYVNFNGAANIGDPLDNYVVYSVSYLDNTTGDCLDAVLEVSTDDAAKVYLNGRRVATDATCGGIAGYGGGIMIPVVLVPDVNIVVIGTCENGGGTGVRLVVRDPAMDPLIDGSVVGSCTPPASYPVISDVAATRAITPGVASTPGGDPVTVTISTTGVTGATTVVDSFPAAMEVVNDGGGSVSGNTITFNINADGDSIYTLQLTGDPDECPFTDAVFSGSATPQGACGAAITGDTSIGCLTICPATPESEDAELVWAFAFGSRDNQCPVFNEPDQNYTSVLHVGGDPLGLAYPDPDLQLAAGQFFPNEEREWGFEILYRDPSLVYVDDPNLIDSPFGDRAGFGIFGPFDDSANNRNEFGDDVDPCATDRIYDSFIGAKDFSATCDALAIGDPDTPCDTVLTPEGIIFRVDVPNGTYKFVAAIGDADNPHAHRVVAENGGAGTPDLIGEHVVLIDNFDQAQYAIGDGDEPGDGVYGAVGFGDKVPPPAQGVDPTPKFVFHDADGLPTSGCPDSPALEVTEGYIRIHALQGNSNDGPGGARDPNGGDFVILEIWSVGEVVVNGGFARGDADANGGAPNITDGIYTLNFLFLGGPPPPCRDAADADDNGAVNITDGIYTLNFLFLGGPPPPPPQAPTCGEDPTGDALDCDSFPPCE